MIDLIILVSLLVLGYGFGTYREKKHYRSIHEREATFQDVLLFDSKYVPDNLGPQTSGGEMVLGHVVISVDYFKRFVAGLRKLFGGKLKSYETLLDRGRREAVLRMKEQAKSLNANMIFNMKFETASISKGASGNIGSVEVYVYGSAIKS
ncbi:MAG: YbjQ family protein [Acidiferrobacterales bacterium]|nr:YbjQ family protein [Acidiferrobacterales bacterium]